MAVFNKRGINSASAFYQTVLHTFFHVSLLSKLKDSGFLPNLQIREMKISKITKIT